MLEGNYGVCLSAGDLGGPIVGELGRGWGGGLDRSNSQGSGAIPSPASSWGAGAGLGIDPTVGELESGGLVRSNSWGSGGCIAIRTS